MKSLEEKVLFIFMSIIFYIPLFIGLAILLYNIIKDYDNSIGDFILLLIFGVLNLSMVHLIHLWFKENYYYCPNCKRMRWIQMRGYSMYCDKCGHYIGEAETPIKDVYDEDAMP